MSETSPLKNASSNPGTWPHVLPWAARSASMPFLPGGMDQQWAVLRWILSALDPELAATREPLSIDLELSDDEIYQRLSPAGLVARDDRGQWTLKEEALNWLNNSDPLYLIAVFHSHTRFIGELLASIASGSSSPGELQAAAARDYGLEWRSLDQIRRRATWLRITGMIERQFDGRFSLTEAGKFFLEHAELADPAKLPHRIIESMAGTSVTFSEPSPALLDLMRQLNEERLLSRRHLIGYIPRSQRDVVAALRDLTTASHPTTTKHDLSEYCSKHFSISPSSFASAIQMLRTTGLLKQVGLEQYETTAAARAWLERDDPIELVRILHVHIRFIGELLAALDEADNPKDLAEIAREQYGISEDVGEIRVRLQVLRNSGLVVETAWGRHRITRLGEQFRESIPLERPKASTDQAKAAVVVAADRTDVEELCRNLKLAARNGAEPRKLEQAVEFVFNFLGFNAQWMGGSGRTDVLVEAALDPSRRYSAIVDAKATGAAAVTEKHIDFDTLNEHSRHHKADYIAVVGISFSGDRLIERARKHGVVLLDIPTLERMILQHAITPLSLTQMRSVFQPKDIAAPLVQLDLAWAAARREQRLLVRVLQQLHQEAQTADPVLRGGMTIDHLYLVLRSEMTDPPSPAELRNVLDLLASPLIGAIEEKDRRYVVLEDPAVTSLRLSRLASAAQEAVSLNE